MTEERPKIVTVSPVEDVQDFHDKMGLPRFKPGFMSDEDLEFRFKFMQEELLEFSVAHHVDGDFVGAVDGLLDLIYVAYGTLLFMGLTPFAVQGCWDEVQRANMTKERAASAADPRSARQHQLDVVKPEGFKPPDISYVLTYYNCNVDIKEIPREVQD